MSFLYNNFLATFFEKLLEYLYLNFIHNYFIIVILVLILIKAILTPFDIKQRESSMKMMKLQPKIDQLKKRYPDPVIQNQKLRELYKKEDVHMMGGCLPAILQMIVLIAFFGALQQLAYKEIVKIVATAAASPGEAVPLQGFLWIRNMWQPDSGSALVMPTFKEWSRILSTVKPEVAATVANITTEEAYAMVIQPTLAAHSGFANGWYILPIIQGITMYFSMGYSLSTAATDDNPMSGPVMKLVMAAMTAWFCLSANILFTIYWIAMNLLMFVQTFFFKKYFEYKEKKNLQKAE
ncbi:MAG: membrane protein insertase YidC [Clostridia bacterium]|nr:membrane protein insertase YidC [Clostridia bacterium]